MFSLKQMRVWIDVKDDEVAKVQGKLEAYLSKLDVTYKIVDIAELIETESK